MSTPSPLPDTRASVCNEKCLAEHHKTCAATCRLLEPLPPSPPPAGPPHGGALNR
jgi:hypothetical protein